MSQSEGDLFKFVRVSCFCYLFHDLCVTNVGTGGGDVKNLLAKKKKEKKLFSSDYGRNRSKM